MDAVKFIIKAIIFALIGIIITCCITPLFIPRWDENYGGVGRRIRGMYNEPKDTIDVAMIGNSNIFNGISNMKLWNDKGISSYTVATPQQSAWTSYYLLKEFYKRQSPKLIIIDADGLFKNKEDSKFFVKQAADCMKFSKNKLDLINDPMYKNTLKSKINYIFPFFRYHTRWKSLKLKNVKKTYEREDAQFKGYQFEKKIKGYKPLDISNEEPKHKSKIKHKEEIINEMPENSQKYFDKILELCKQNNTEVLMIYIPTIGSWNKERSAFLTQYAQEKGIPYIDYNLKENFDWKKNTSDKGWHLNIYGAEIITGELEQTLDNYNLSNHKDDDLYKKWNQDYELYTKLKENTKYKK